MFITALCVIFLVKLRWPKEQEFILKKKKQLIKAYFPCSNQRLSCTSKKKKEQNTKYVVEWHLVLGFKGQAPSYIPKSGINYFQKFISAVCVTLQLTHTNFYGVIRRLAI